MFISVAEILIQFLTFWKLFTYVHKLYLVLVCSGVASVHSSFFRSCVCLGYDFWLIYKLKPTFSKFPSLVWNNEFVCLCSLTDYKKEGTL